MYHIKSMLMHSAKVLSPYRRGFTYVWIGKEHLWNFLGVSDSRCFWLFHSEGCHTKTNIRFVGLKNYENTLFLHICYAIRLCMLCLYLFYCPVIMKVWICLASFAWYEIPYLIKPCNITIRFSIIGYHGNFYFIVQKL